ncbi:hypothetical protein E2C01_096362 [Portunus trituberculatus]|uniref:Uncharacterized protein n=1 Tax=Portunus trituberculatus TaxID=210409 RepID=A0A5B7K6C4_PORTR|nr:hypothetical protein [Portunus trituberculatus]
MGRVELGITINDNLSPEKHVNNITGETYELLKENELDIYIYLYR